MAIYSNGGYHFRHDDGNALKPTSANFQSTGLQSIWPSYLSAETDQLASGASTVATSDILDLYCSGHWGQGLAMIIQVYTEYYGCGIDTFKVLMERGAYASITHLPDLSHGGEQNGSGCLTVTGNTVIGTGTHSGQNVLRSTIQMSTGAVYKRARGVIHILPGSAQHRVIFDNQSTQANVTTNRVSNGGGYHFRSINLTGHPNRDTA